jgi:peptidoglycan/xylan/chitin deacetylase (PgdA/CDA1 family)
MTDRAVVSIDFELFQHTPAYRAASGELDDHTVGLDAWPFLRDVLAEHDATATFFVVGEVAEQHPEVIANIADYGHEIASHTYSHRLMSSLDGDTQTAELEQSRDAIQAATGQSVAGFRAPAFDVPVGLLRRLEDAGYAYDSSIVPARRIPGWYGGEYEITTPCSAADIDPEIQELGELPISVMPSIRLPLSGAWTRLLGRTYTQIGMKTIARQGGVPILYFHPWELVDLPPVEGVPRRVTWRTGKWLRQTIRDLLAMDFEFVTAASIIEEERL